MNLVAFKMLVGDRAKYFGIVMGLTFASLLITQQAAIFIGLMERTYNAINDVGLPDIWVMDPKVQFVDDVKPIQDTKLLAVRGIVGVEWAMPMYKGLIKARLDDGNFQTCIVLGLDDTTMVGGPPKFAKDTHGNDMGKLADLRRSDSIIVDSVGARTKLARKTSDGKTRPLQVGEILELNDHRATVVGICEVARTFQSQPVIYTTYSRAKNFAPPERRLLSFVLVKAKPGQNVAELCKRITDSTGLAAMTQQGFIKLTYDYYMKHTGIPINFFIAIALGFIVGTAIAGQTFYNFTLDNLKHFGALKAMGASNGMLLRMIVFQSLIVGVIGYGIGVGLASCVGLLTGKTELAFKLPWQLLVGSAGAVLVICIMSAVVSIIKVMRLEPAIVFKG